MYYTNLFGKVVEITDEHRANKLLRDGKMRVATKEEVEAHMRYVREQFYNEVEVPTGNHNSIYYKTVRETPDGYGMSSAIIGKELKKLGVSAELNYNEQKVGLLYSYPYGVVQMDTPVRLIYTMFESDSIPKEWPDYLHQADEVLVPSKWCQEVFAKAGVDTTVVPLGYNDKVFKYINRAVPVEEGKDFTFLHYNGYNPRKGFMEVVKAFVEEFGHDEPVKMIIKTTLANPPLPLNKHEYPNIEVISGMMTENDLSDLIGRSNCFVYPSRGEGFGITPLEAMATGIPAIVPNAHGISEYFNPEYMLEAKVGEKCPALYNRFKGQYVGEMVVCDVKELRRQMRYAYNHQAEMRDLGNKASEYVKQWTYTETARKLKEVIDKWQTADVSDRVDSDKLAVERF